MDIENYINEPGSLEYSLIKVNLESLRIVEFDEKFTEITGYNADDVSKGLATADIIISPSVLKSGIIWDSIRLRQLITRRYKIRRKDGITSVVNCSFFADDGDDSTVKVVVTDMYENEREIIWAQISRQMMCALNIYDGISQGLDLIGRHLELDRATFVEFDPELTHITRALQWNAQGTEKTLDIIYDIDLKDVKSRGYSGSYVIYSEGECYPKSLTEIFSRFEVSSLLGYAVHDKDNIYGFIFIASLEKRVWSVGQYEVLQTIADVIMSGLRNNRTEEMLWLTRENDRKILSCISTAVIAVDKQSNEIIYRNSAARQFFPKVNLGEKCYTSLRRRDIRCAECPDSANGTTYRVGGACYRINVSEMIWEDSRHVKLLQYVPMDVLSSELTEKKFSFIYTEPCDIYYEINITRKTCKTTVLNEKFAFPLGEIAGDLHEGFEDFLSKYVDEKTGADLRDRVMRRVIEQKKSDSTELEILNTNGGRLSFMFRAIELIDENNTLMIIAAKNITDQKKAMRFEKQIRATTNCSVSRVYPFVVTVDVTMGEYMIIRNESKKMSIADSGKYEDYHSYFCALIHPEDREAYAKMLSTENLQRRFSNHGKELTMISRCLEETDNQYHWLSMIAVRVDNSGSDNITLVLVGRYIDTERYREKGVREELAKAEAANRSRNAFLSRMSHDMRTPLNSIINMTELAQKNITIPALAQECLDKSRLSSRYLLSLVNNVLDLARYENGKLTLSRDIIDMEKFISDICEMVQPEIEFKQQRFTVYRRNPVCTSVYGDETRLKQIVMNLVTNSIKFTSDGGKIDFTIDESLSESNIVFMSFRVSDNGIGMSKEFQKRLFIPFEQEHTGSKTYGGSGLGLSICCTIVEAMDGKISVFSEMGKGTEFEVKLALDTCKTKEKKEEKQKQPLNLVCRHVLLVEDDKINAEIAEMLLSAENVQSEIAFNGKMAIEKFKASEENYYDAILMDIQMPVMDGLEATKIIRAMKRPDAQTIPIIAMTANVYIKDIEEAKAYGMTSHVQKPVNPKLLYEALQKCCEK